MKKIIIVVALLVFLLCGCSKEEIVLYDVNICDASLADMYAYLEKFQDENSILEKNDFSAEQIDALIESFSQNETEINSITLYSKNITDETAADFISLASEKNIPVTFALSEISSDVLMAYDKAFCITTDHSHAAEEMAARIKEMWTSGVVKDTDKNQIFSFSVVRDENWNSNTELFYTTLTEFMELYGIPMQLNSTLTYAELENEKTLLQLREKNEGFIVLCDSLLPYYEQYSPAGDGVEIITMLHGTENSVKDYPFVSSCFVDYKNYKLVADEILNGFNDKEFPLDNVLFPYIDHTVYIPATVL